MNIKDLIVVKQWLRTNATLQEVIDTSCIGLVGNERFTCRAKEVFFWLWTWSAHRFEGAAGRAQNEVYFNHGMAGLCRRIERVQRIIKRLKESP